MRHTGTMTESGNTRVAVYLDFDNIVISRYDQVNGRNSFQKDKSKGLDQQPEKLAKATVDVGAVAPCDSRDCLGRYPVAGQLGAGGMGEVLQVRDDDLGREVASKVILGQADQSLLN